MKALVSGATGFIGQALCEQLMLRGDDVIALSRSGEALPTGCQTVACDLSAAEPGPAVWQGVEVCFHLAGIAHRRARPAQYQTLNTEATLRMARAAAAAGVRRFIYLSSVKAMGAPVTVDKRSECDTVAPIDAYGLSKWRAEQALRQEFSGTAMSVIIVRPALVYGPGVKGNLRTLIRIARLGCLRPPPGGGRSMIAIDDLVSLLLLLAQLPVSGTPTWIACSDETVSTRALYDMMRSALGKAAGRQCLPRRAWQLAAHALDARSGHNGDSTYAKLFGTELYSNAAVVAATAWQPRVTLAQGIAQMVAGAAAR